MDLLHGHRFFLPNCIERSWKFNVRIGPWARLNMLPGQRYQSADMCIHTSTHLRSQSFKTKTPLLYSPYSICGTLCGETICFKRNKKKQKTTKYIHLFIYYVCVCVGRSVAVISEDTPPLLIREKTPPVEEPGRSLWSGGWRVRLWTDRSAVRICLVPEHFGFPPVVHDWVNKGLGMSSCVCMTGHISYLVTLNQREGHRVARVAFLIIPMFSPWRWT